MLLRWTAIIWCCYTAEWFLWKGVVVGELGAWVSECVCVCVWVEWVGLYVCVSVSEWIDERWAVEFRLVHGALSMEWVRIEGERVRGWEGKREIAKSERQQDNKSWMQNAGNKNKREERKKRKEERKGGEDKKEKESKAKRA